MTHRTKLAYSKLNYLAEMPNKRFEEFLQMASTRTSNLHPNPIQSYLWNLYEELKPIIPTTLFELTAKELAMLSFLKIAHDIEKPDQTGKS